MTYLFAGQVQQDLDIYISMASKSTNRDIAIGRKMFIVPTTCLGSVMPCCLEKSLVSMASSSQSMYSKKEAIASSFVGNPW